MVSSYFWHPTVQFHKRDLVKPKVAAMSPSDLSVEDDNTLAFFNDHIGEYYFKGESIKEILSRDGSAGEFFSRATEDSLIFKNKACLLQFFNKYLFWIVPSSDETDDSLLAECLFSFCHRDGLTHVAAEAFNIPVLEDLNALSCPASLDMESISTVDGFTTVDISAPSQKSSSPAKHQLKSAIYFDFNAKEQAVNIRSEHLYNRCDSPKIDESYAARVQCITSFKVEAKTKKCVIQVESLAIKLDDETLKSACDQRQFWTKIKDFFKALMNRHAFVTVQPLIKPNEPPITSVETGISSAVNLVVSSHSDEGGDSFGQSVYGNVVHPDPLESPQN